MTIEEISKAVSPDAPLPRRQVYRYLAACGIEATKPRKRPAQYPVTAAAAIAQHIGLELPKAARVRSSGIPSMAALRAEAKKARGK